MDIKIVGEIGINHNGSVSLATDLIDAAVDAGFNYVKFQKRDPDISTPFSQKEVIKKTPWGNMRYIDYKKRIEFDRIDYDYISQYCKKRNIGWFASVWDMSSAKFLYDMNCSIVKIPSAKLTDLDLLRYCRQRFEYVIMSTGMSTEEEIRHSYIIGKPDVLMHSVSIYPTNFDNVNLKYISWLKNNYHCKEVGYSGHEEGIDLSTAAAACGATWIERHITLNKNYWGSDHIVSIIPSEMKEMVLRIRNVEKALIGEYAPRKLLEGEKLKRKQLRG